MSRKKFPLGLQEIKLLAAMAEEGCPICDNITGTDDHYFFWFFNESYYEAHTLDDLTRSLGFCPAHSARLLRSTGSYQLAAVHEVLVRRLRAMLAGNPESAPTTYGLCPPCRDRQEAASGTAFWLAKLLEDPVGADRYGRPGILCFPHLQAVLPRVSQMTFERLLAVHESAMTPALESLREVAVELGPISSEGRQDLVKALLPSLRLAVGHEKGNGAYPAPHESGVSPRSRDPVGDFLEALGRAEACPVCLEVRRAWIEWIAWLQGAVPRGSAVEDLLPTCPEHVWATVHAGGAFLGLATAQQALGATQGVVQAARQILKPPPPGDHERLMQRVERALRGPRYRLRVAREGVGRAIRCPVCDRLDVARDRALSLLFTLLEDRQHGALVGSAYGLCLKHFSRALELGPRPAVRTLLIEVQVARLARLQWELEEFLRKVAWNWRPEAKGAEQTAWRRAVLRFSGSLEGRAG